MIDRVGMCRYKSSGPSEGNTYSAFISRHAQRLQPKKLAVASKNKSALLVKMFAAPKRMRAKAANKLTGHMKRQNLVLFRRAKCAPLPMPTHPNMGIMNDTAGGWPRRKLSSARDDDKKALVVPPNAAQLRMPRIFSRWKHSLMSNQPFSSASGLPSISPSPFWLSAG